MTPDRLLRIFGWLLVAAYLGVVVVPNVRAQIDVPQGDIVWLTDFNPLHAAGMQLRREPAETLYDAEKRHHWVLQAANAMYGMELSRIQVHAVGLAAWMHPPVFMLYVLPLGWMGFFLAFVTWLSGTAIFYFAAVRVAIPDRAAWLFGAASPPFLYNLMYGQTGFLSGGLIGLGLGLLHRRPALSGVLIGLACFKPHFGLLIPLALIVGGYWRSFVAAALTVAGMVTASMLAFGMAAWLRYFEATKVYVLGFESGQYAMDVMVSVLAAGFGLKLGAAASWKIQYAATATCFAVVAWAWWRREGTAHLHGLRVAVLCAATLLAVPMVYQYDVVLLVPGAAFLWQDMRTRNAAAWEVATLFCLLASLLLTRTLFEMTGAQIGPLLFLGILGVAVFRLHRALTKAAGAERPVGQPAA